MYYIDYHTHSRLSPDSSAPLEEMAKAAVRAGLSELCVTDHYDVVDQSGHLAGEMDWASAVAQYRRVKVQFEGKLTLKLGLEFGSGSRDGAALAHAPAELDFVIGSLHNFSERAGGGDYFYGEYEDSAICYAALDDYFYQMALLAPTQVYDVLGHIIYPLRYTQPPCREKLSLEGYTGALRDLLRVTAESGRGMEVNTYRGQTLAEWRPILDLFREVGGEIVTVGSDAHTPGDMAKGVREAYALLEEAGFRYITVYEGRKPRFVKL